MPLLCSVSGLRFTVDDFPAELIEQMVHAFVRHLPDGPVAIGWDGRQGAEHLEDFVLSLLQAEGRSIHRLGVVPTPTIQTWIARRRLPGGIAITASHNSAEWHGLKFLAPGGLTYDATLFYRQARSGNAPLPNGYPVRTRTVRWMHFQAISEHLHSLWRPRWLRQLRDTIAQAGFHIVVDTVNAAGSTIVPLLLQQLRCRITLLHADGSGIFPHAPEPLPQHLHELTDCVRQYRADIGVAVDPDADRLVVVDETGQCLWEELTIVLATQAIWEHRQSACGSRYQPLAVVNYSTTSAVDAVAQTYGARVLRAPVGEVHVVRLLQQASGVIGGEGSGGVILPHVHYGRDALVGIVLILGLMAQQRKPLSELAAAVPRPVMHKHAFPAPASVPELLERVSGHVAPYAKELHRADGLYARLGNAWFHLRPSNTEPLLRLILEAPTRTELEQLEALIWPFLRRQ